MKASQSVLLIAFLFFSQSLVHTFKHDNYVVDTAFLQDNGIIILFEKLADRLLTILNKRGVDMNSPTNVKNLFNFLQNADLVDDEEEEKPKSFKQKLWMGLKKAAKGIGKQALVHATKVLVGYGVKEGMPELENIVKNSLTALPVKLKVAIAPIVYTLFKNLFRKAKVSPPPGFNLNEIILHGLNEHDRKLALKYMTNGIKKL